MTWHPDGRSTHERGYGRDHRNARARAAAQHQPTDPCVRCGRPLGEMNPRLHFDHTPDRNGYLGFSHATCNITAGAREGSRRAHRKQERRGQSRRW